MTILFSDIEGSTALNEKMGDRAWVKLLGRHDRLVQKCVKNRSGHVVKNQGDGYMISEAVRDALRGQDDIALDDGREVELKGFAGQHRLYAIR